MRLRLPRVSGRTGPRRPLSIARQRGLVGIGLALAASAVAFSSLVAVNAMATRTVREEHSYRFTGSVLAMDVAVGEVQIVPGKDGEITVARRLTYGLRRPFLEERIDGDTFRVRDDNCTAETFFPCQVRWLLQVPRNLSVEVRTVSGAITVSGLSGTVKLTSVSGSVKALAPSGKLVTLRSHDGSVTAQNVSSAQVVATSDNRAVTLTFRSPPSLVVGRSQRGPVGVVLPGGDDAYKISAKSPGGGSRTVAVIKTADDAHRRIDILSASNDVSVIQSPEN
jgi:DUF4097 and DUF4098 domain-containing protein YvlB